MLSMKNDAAGPATERFVNDVEETFANLAQWSKKASAAVRRLQQHADALALMAGAKIVRVRQEPLRDETGQPIRRNRRGRPPGSRNRQKALLLYAGEAQIEQLRQQLQGPER